MKQITKIILLLTFSVFSAGLMNAQKSNVKGAERIANSSKPNFEEARQLATLARENDETKDAPKTWYVSGLVEEKEFTKENQKLVEHKEEPNKALMNLALLQMYSFYSETYAKEVAMGEKKYTKKITKAFENNLPYYINALGYYMEQKDFKQALRAAECFKSIKKMPIFNGTPTAELDSNAMMLDFFAILAAYQADQKQQAIAYAQEAKKVPYRQNEVYQILSQTLLEVGDTTNYVATMEEGFALFPNEAYYSLNLINLFSEQGKFDQARKFLSAAIEKDSQNPQLYDVMGRLYENEGNPTEAHNWFLKSLEIDPNYADGVYDVGRSFFNMAAKATEEKVTPETQAQAKEFFKKALPYLEKAYEQNPERVYYILANVHYNLGNNSRYDEIMELHGGSN